MQPTFKLAVETKLIQFEEKSPSVQKLEFIDDTGYMRHPLVNTPLDIPTVKSVVSHVKMPLGGFDAELSRVDPGTNVPTDDIDENFARAAAHRFTAETLKARYQKFGVFDAGQPFVPHTAYMFARFDSNQLKKLKPCQLQVYSKFVGPLGEPPAVDIVRALAILLFRLHSLDLTTAACGSCG